MQHPLVDTFGRMHNNLRISVTDRCNIRCFYCMPADDVVFMKRAQLLSFEEIEKFVRIVAPLGVNKIRLTGGEPLVRKDLPRLIEKLVGIPGIKDVGLTTNGILLAEQAAELYEAGLRRLNVSLDALDPKKFEEITRRTGYEKVVEGIQVAQKVGFDPIKVNAVAMRGITEDQLIPFGHFARETGAVVRFIEFMPLDSDNAWERDKVLFASEMIDRLSSEIMPLVPLDEQVANAPAKKYRFEDGRGEIGFISSVSHPFCSDCNRFRLTADGRLRNCLFSLEETSIKELLRDENKSDDDIIQAVAACIQEKKAGHDINNPQFVQPDRPMHSIGG